MRKQREASTELRKQLIRNEKLKRTQCKNLAKYHYQMKNDGVSDPALLPVLGFGPCPPNHRLMRIVRQEKARNQYDRTFAGKSASQRTKEGIWTRRDELVSWLRASRPDRPMDDEDEPMDQTRAMFIDNVVALAPLAWSIDGMRL